MFVVFGATGFIGLALQTALRARRESYVGFGSATCVRCDGAEVAQVPLADAAGRAALLAQLPPPTAVVFAAGPAVTSTDPAILRTSHLGSLSAAFEIIPESWWEGLPFVYTSSCTVYDRVSPARPLVVSDPVAPHSAYAEVKLQCEHFLAQTLARAGARPVAARLFNVGGFGQRAGIVFEIARQAIELRAGRREAFRLRTNKPILDLTDVNEVAAALLALAQAPLIPAVVNVCSGRPVTTEDLIAAARRAIGIAAPVSYAVETDDRHMLVGNPALMTARTGWRARRSLDQILPDVISGVQNTGATA